MAKKIIRAIWIGANRILFRNVWILDGKPYPCIRVSTHLLYSRLGLSPLITKIESW